MGRSRVLLGALICLAFAFPKPAQADSIPLGFVTFDNFIPDPGGTNAFFVSNLTGDPSTGGFALPPDFPVVTTVVFDSPLLSWTGAPGSPYDFANVGIGPGSPDPPPEIQFPDTASLLSAVFSAQLSTSVLQLSDGQLFTALSPLISATLTDPGGALAPGDLVVLSVDAEEVPTSTVPEPGTLMLLASGLVAYRLGRRRKTQAERT